MNDLVNIPQGMPAAFAKNLPADLKKSNEELTSGVLASFGVLSIRGKAWRIKYKGDEQVMTNKEGDTRSSVEVVIISASPDLSKIYYAKSYVEGDDQPPDCFSLDGKKPDPSSPAKQAELCQTCKWNAFGSRITEQGTKAKACSDSRRCAVVPAGDIDNERFGGPMLLRIPPASLAALSTYSDKLTQVGRPYFTVVTRCRFDPKTAYPKLDFEPAGIIEDNDEAEKILALRNSPEVARILHDARDLADVASTSTEPPPQTETAPAPAPAPTPAEPEPEKVASVPAEKDPFDALGVSVDVGLPSTEGEAPTPAAAAAAAAPEEPKQEEAKVEHADAGLESAIDGAFEGLKLD